MNAAYELLDALPFGAATIQRRRLRANDLVVITLEQHAAPIVAYHTWFAVGSRHEPARLSGLAHLFEHMMFKATTNHPEGELDAIMERMGARTNAATWVDWTCYHQAFPARGDNLQTTIDLEADRMVNLVLDEEQLQSEREVVLNERKYRVDDDPIGRTYEALWRLSLGDHPYGRPTIGWAEDIRRIGLEDCRAFYDTWYAPNSAAVIVVGDFDTDDVLRRIETAYGDLPSRPRPEIAHASYAPVTAPRRAELPLPLSADRLAIGFHAPAIATPELCALEVAHEVLFGGDSARAHQRLVEEEELASSVEGWVSQFTWPGMSEVSATAIPGVAAEAIEPVILEEIARLAADGPSKRELRKARNQLEVAEYRARFSPDAMAGRIGHFEATAGDYRQMMSTLEITRQITANDVRSIAERYLAADARSVVVARSENCE